MNVSIFVLIVGVVCLGAASAAPQLRQRNEKQVQTVEDEFPYKGATIEEVVVESALYIKPKATQQMRRVRSADSADSPLQGIYATHKRVKRGRRGGATQVGTSAGAGGTNAGVVVGAGPDGGNANANVQLNPFGPLGPSGFNQEQAASNGAAHSNYNNGFNAGSSAADAQAQGFQSQTANGSFGASSASTATQSQNISPFGSNNAAGASLSQVYKLPNGQTINFSSTNSFANNGANKGSSHGAAVSVSR
ncbi:uncharacterized protein LOC108153177 [Drosophila miranda]|uniref:uncharacterized protein LOC108153177 n=1 Tax=Drosophila miranda TaxID=7229 RepID=UPI0007E5FB40|nr:uncharacterized protein LOC108153177 [Drosophila miranda]